jgi:iron complex transport system permease protein
VSGTAPVSGIAPVTLTASVGPRTPEDSPAPPARTVPAAPPGHHLLRLGRVSVLLHRRTALVTLALSVLLAGLAVGCLAVGSVAVEPMRTFAALFGVGEPRDLLVVQRLRLPRVEAGVAVGVALGLSGCLMQTLARNRLATPETTGLNNGATAFAVASVVAVPTGLAPPGMALTGAATAAALTLGLAGGAGARGYRFLVVGLGIGATFGAVTNLLLARADIDAANAALPWTVGTLNVTAGPAVRLLEAGLLLALPAAVLLGRSLGTMRFSDAVATGLGTPLRGSRIAVLATAVVVAGLSVAVAGPLGMVALAAPEAARRLCGAGGPVPLVASAVTGAIFTLLADLVGRVAFTPLEIPAGLVTAVVGGPYLLWLLLTTRTRTSP